MATRRSARRLASPHFVGLALLAPSLFMASLARAGDPPADAPKETPPEAAAPAPETKTPAAEPERISGKLYKVDAENKSITVLVEPERGRSGRAFRRYKLFLDDKSLILIDQQPSTIEALE